MKLTHKILTFAAMTSAMTSAASASYMILGTSIDVGGSTYAGSSLSGVNLGVFSASDTLTLDGTAGTALYRAEVLNSFNGAPIPAGAVTDNNYIHAPNGDGATLKVMVDGELVLDQMLDLAEDPGSDKGIFGWGDAATLAGIDLIAAVGGEAGEHTVSYEIEYTFTAWDFDGGGNVQADPQTHSPMTSTATFTVVPEPSSLALLGLGGVSLTLRRRR